jgi:chloride channel 3/4/5
MNSYPFLDNKVRPIFTTELGDITPRVREERIIDISDSPLIPAKELRQRQEYLHMAGELDGGLPIVRDKILVGLIPAPDLEFALDKLENEDNSLCLMSTQVQWNTREDEEEEDNDPTDFTPYIDPAPVALDIHSPMDLVYECFVKLGLRYICVLRDGRYAGLVRHSMCTLRGVALTVSQVHKKAFVKYIKELEEH